MTRILTIDEVRRAKQEKVNRIREELARRDLMAFGEFTDPEYKRAKHLLFVQKKLEQVQRFVETGGKEGIGRLIISMPPRHSKSSTGSIKWPLLMLGQHPDWRFVIASYSQDKANDFSRAVRDTIHHSEEYSLLFPKTIMNVESAAVERWHLLGAAPDKPTFIAVGVDGPIVGRGGNIIIIDDLVKSRADAESPALRENVRRYYAGTLRTRLEPNGAIIILNTRWHEDDIIGSLIDQQRMGGETWEVINLPAVAERDDDVLGRRPGDALWPERWPYKTLMEIKQGITLGAGGTYEWESQYQGHPKPPEGSKISIVDFQYAEHAPEGLDWKRYWDLALSEKTAASFTASCKGAFDRDMNFWIADIMRLKMEWPDVEERMKQTLEQELTVEHGIEEKLHGLAIVGQFTRDERLARSRFHGVKVDTSKLDRALPWISRLEAKKVFLVRGPWIPDFLDEARNFTGVNDLWTDQIDSVSGVYQMLANPRWKKINFKKV